MLIVISGGSRGIGKTVALHFAKQGFNVAICSRNRTKLDACKSEILKANPKSKVFTMVCDMGVKSDVIQFAKSVLNEFKKVDILMNNAGIFTADNILDADEGSFENMMNINLSGNFHLTKALVPAMPQNGKSLIINMCSIASRQAYSSGSLYTIGKHALLGFSRSLREELKTMNIKVTSLLPGAVLTDSWAGSGHPDSRFMKPKDVAQLMWSVYSLSEQTVVEEIILRPMLGDI